MIVTTMNDIPGYTVEEVFGEVFGLTVRSRNIGSQLGAGLKSILGGELKGMTKALVDSRNQVTERMVEEAEAKGANAIVAMRFDTSEMGPNWRSEPAQEIEEGGGAVDDHVGCFAERRRAFRRRDGDADRQLESVERV